MMFCTNALMSLVNQTRYGERIPIDCFGCLFLAINQISESPGAFTFHLATNTKHSKFKIVDV